MAYSFYIEPSVNCVFVRHFDVFHVDDTLNQYHEMIEKPEYLPNMNVIRDVLTTTLPDEFGYKFFSEKTPDRYKDIESVMGQSNVAWVLGNGKDYAIMHQFTLTARFADSLSHITRKPFRTLEAAREWLEIPPDYEIHHDAIAP
ncbi:MAG: hypothetical protein HON14_02810 [Rhodospirillaceae bacterium]|jgi:hypothetical protein|nr:hypothetical protein [Rhodospirillaceae bacterium]MBT5941551.1 hypothetical protein [Rhodospirillaceae bacterium]MBT7268133.1 hypothetical protein [Rhodospirillaceae bacterium]